MRRRKKENSLIIAVCVAAAIGIPFLLILFAYSGNMVSPVKTNALGVPVPKSEGEIARDRLTVNLKRFGEMAAEAEQQYEAERPVLNEFHGDGPGVVNFTAPRNWLFEWKSDDVGLRVIKIEYLDENRPEILYGEQYDDFDKRFSDPGRYRVTVDYQGSGNGPWRIRIRKRPDRIN